MKAISINLLQIKQLNFEYSPKLADKPDTASLKQGENHIELNALNNGIYLVRITTINGSSTHHKFIKQ